MNRRVFLATFTWAVGFAGCVGRDPAAGAPETTAQSPRVSTTPDGTASGTETGTGTRRSTGTKAADGSREQDVQRRVSLAGADDAEREYDLRIDVELLEETITAEHTARVRVTTTNEGERRGISIAEDMCSLFDRDGGASEPPGLYLHSPGSTKWIDRPGERWTDGTDPREPRGVAAYGCASAVYAEGESVTNEYAVWDDYQVAGYLRVGTYRFEETVRIQPPGDSITSNHDQEPIAEFDWGFDLTVTLPET